MFGLSEDDVRRIVRDEIKACQGLFRVMAQDASAKYQPGLKDSIDRLGSIVQMHLLEQHSSIAQDVPEQVIPAHVEIVKVKKG